MVAAVRIAILLLFTFAAASYSQAGKCFKCTVYAFVGGETRCANPGVCEGAFCYTCQFHSQSSNSRKGNEWRRRVRKEGKNVASTGAPLLLSGCLSAGSSPPQTTNFSVMVPFCHAVDSVALCFCQSPASNDDPPPGTTPPTLPPLRTGPPFLTSSMSFCNRHFNESTLVGELIKPFDFDELSMRTTGVSSDYVRKRLSHMNLGDIPDIFQGEIINGQPAPRISHLVPFIVISVLSSSSYIHS